jgi:F-type H+-transporting ATPase subunit gamma
MKSLSAHHLRETRNAVEPARIYREGIEPIVASSGATLGPGSGPAGLLVIGGELGLCGDYNSRLIAAAADRRGALGPGSTTCVGHRAGAFLARRHVEVDRVYAAPTSVRGITELLLRLVEDVLTVYVTRQLSSFDIVSSRFGGVGVHRPVDARLLPVEAMRVQATPAVRYVSAGQLASAAIREFLYVTVYDVLLDALASEHGARLVATQSAEKWLDERTERVRRQLAASRRETSTQEVIEIAAGARARRK